MGGQSYRGIECADGVVVFTECGVGEEEDAADWDFRFGC
jgi:hypothetical protein